ncbi:lamin tail domain-containing protein [Rubrivirga marina]|uniref:LTD domain-containing protein n=1 Tax=Rubrivirga marina TaxID=1196024 RepID=A0A271J1I6_9BACT|nr:lamin tail domain-containing protein [Rubrivirga marina]PAP76825.1 hypothetical protein BSZ37_10470 [Rubrivirga marina]
MRWLSLVCLALVSTSTSAQAPVAGDLIINEVMYDPPAPQPSGNEWVEILNVTDGPLDLGGLLLTDDGSATDPIPGGTTLAAGDYLVIARDGEAFAEAYPGVPFVDLDGFPSLNNTGDRPALLMGGTEIDAVPYLPSWGGSDASLERRDPLGPSTEAGNFGTTTSPDGGTPGAQNTLFFEDTTPPTLVAAEALDAQTVRVTFGEPVDPATTEVVSNYTIGGGARTPAMAMRGDVPSEVVLALAAPLEGPASYSLTVRNVADLRGNAIAEASTTFFFGEGGTAGPRDLVINEFLYDEPTSDTPGEFVELLNRTDQAFDLRDLTLNDGTGDPEPVTDQLAFVGPGEYAVIVEDGELFAAVFPSVPFVEQPAWSALNNTGDAIVLKYGDVTVDSLFYDPAWGGEDASLERKDPDGPSSVASNYATTTDLRGGTPGVQNSRYEPDVTGPQLVSASAGPDGRRVTVTLDEPADPASVTASAFSLESGPTVTEAAYDGATTVTLALASVLSAGTTTITATSLVDLLGNTTASTSTTVEFTPDTTAPGIVRASALPDAPGQVRVTFTEPVTDASATDAGAYDVVGLGQPVVSVTELDTANEVGILSVELALAEPLDDQTLYTLSVTGLTDLAGNVTDRAEARFLVGTPDTPGPGDVVVTEIMFDPQTGSDGEYLELLNATADGVFDLRGITLDDGSGNGDVLSGEATILLPSEPLTVVRDAAGFRAAFPEAPFVEGTGISLSNSGEAIVLRADGAVLDSVAYDPDWHRVELDDATGISLERRDPAGPPNDPANWSSSLDVRGGTPSAPNSVGLSETPVEREAGLTITSPFAPTRGEAAQITYQLSTEAGLVRARIYDGGGRFVREVEAGRLSGSTATLTWDGTDDARRPLRAGIYVVLVEAVDAQGGTTETLRGVVVLARP